MKDRVFFGIIGILVGIVAMQWTMPTGVASPTTSAGQVVAAVEDNVLMIDGSMWTTVGAPGGTVVWEKLAQLPVPIDQVAIYCGPTLWVDLNGDMWGWGGDERGWLNFGHPTIPPVATSSSTWGKIKSTFTGSEKQ